MLCPLCHETAGEENGTEDTRWLASYNCGHAMHLSCAIRLLMLHNTHWRSIHSKRQIASISQSPDTHFPVPACLHMDGPITSGMIIDAHLINSLTQLFEENNALGADKSLERRLRLFEQFSTQHPASGLRQLHFEFQHGEDDIRFPISGQMAVSSGYLVTPTPNGFQYRSTEIPRLVEQDLRNAIRRLGLFREWSNRYERLIYLVAAPAITAIGASVISAVSGGMSNECLYVFLGGVLVAVLILMGGLQYFLNFLQRR